VVKALQDRINDLEARLQTVPTPNGPGTDTVLEVSHDTNGTLGSLQKEAEEVGFLVTGGSELYSGSKYGKLILNQSPGNHPLISIDQWEVLPDRPLQGSSSNNSI
jgi:hypothetical protein